MEENERGNEINEMLELMEDILEESKPVILSSKVQVDKDEMFDLIKDIRLRLPNEIQQSKWVVKDKTKILSQAQMEADMIVEEAHDIVKRMTMEHEITRLAQEEADRILHAARLDAREMHLGAVEYAESVLKEVEGNLNNTLELFHSKTSEFEDSTANILRTVYENRKELKGGVPVLPEAYDE